MATGDLGAAVIAVAVVFGTSSCPHALRVAGDVHVEVDVNGTDIRVRTVNIDALGNIGAFIDEDTFAATAFAAVSIRHIAGDVYALIYTRSGGSLNVKTIHISDAGVINAVAIATVNVSPSGGLMAGPKDVLLIAPNIYVAALDKQAAPSGLRIVTFSISDDGTVIANIDTDDHNAAGAGAKYVDIAHISGDLYMACWNKGAPDLSVSVSTYHITAAGAITYIGSTILDTGDIARIRMVRVNKTEPSIWAFFYTFAGPTYRIRTLTVNADGSFGAVVDTDDAICTSRPHSVLAVGDDVYLFVRNWGDGLVFRTVHIAADGTIGALHDSVTYAVTTCDWPTIGRSRGNIYFCAYQQTGVVRSNILTFECETRDEGPAGGRSGNMAGKLVAALVI